MESFLNDVELIRKYTSLGLQLLLYIFKQPSELERIFDLKDQIQKIFDTHFGNFFFFSKFDLSFVK